MAQRKDAGNIRECHGDLHLGNLVLLGERLTPFDCIEFSEDLRWIDTMNELAFICMDLEVHGRADYATRLLNRYLEVSGDYDGLTLLPYYQTYRAMVRAKIACLADRQAPDPAQRARLGSDFLRYLGFASHRTKPASPLLIITHGFSGSGKSWLASALAERLGAIRISSDIERKRLAGLGALENSRLAKIPDLYSQEMTALTYQRLLSIAERLLKAGFPVILDATYLIAEHRRLARNVAEQLAICFRILDIQAPDSILRERILARRAAGNDPSEADVAVMEWQQSYAEALEPGEFPEVLAIDSGRPVDLDGLVAALSIQGRFTDPSSRQ